MLVDGSWLVQRLQAVKHFQIQSLLHVVHQSLLVKQLGKNMLVSFDASLREQVAVGSDWTTEELVKGVHAGQDGIVLERVGPSFGLSVVLAQQIMVGHMLPHLNRLFCHHHLRTGPLECLQKRGLATTDVALNGEYHSPHEFN